MVLYGCPTNTQTQQATVATLCKVDKQQYNTATFIRTRSPNHQIAQTTSPNFFISTVKVNIRTIVSIHLAVGKIQV
jgi:hypothetical protein